MRCLVALALLLAGGDAAQSCPWEDAGSGTVRAVLDGRTFALTDGREVRLAGIEVAAATGGGSLKQLIGGRDVTLKRLSAQNDRYGRLVAFAFVTGEARPVQQVLLAGGHARVSARVGDMGCARQLFGVERTARSARTGRWSDRAHAPKNADEPAAVLAERGRFTLVEGQVVSVRESGGTIYVNFGRRWSEDFTATVLRRHERTFAAAGVDLKKLAGRRVLLRGVIEERGGPWIELTRPEQVEVVDGP